MQVEAVVRSFRLPEHLRAYFTGLYAFILSGPDGATLEDFIHPEWAGLHFSNGEPPMAAVGEGRPEPCGPFLASGPNSKPIRFVLTSPVTWGLGLKPAGWARLVDFPAEDLVDQLVDGNEHDAFQEFRPILSIVEDNPGNVDEVAGRICDYLAGNMGEPARYEGLILACQDALRDPEIASVADLRERLGINPRALERLCARCFGFSPKQLLRRQRFLRSMTAFMRGRATGWTGAIDPQYYDQPHFVREFNAFMGMTPSEYAGLPHPIFRQIVEQLAPSGMAGDIRR